MTPTEFVRACEKAHIFADWHHQRHRTPDPEAFWADWEVFSSKVKAGPEAWSQEQWSVMLVYAKAALHYDPPNTGATRQQWRTGGLWAAGDWGNIGGAPDGAETDHSGKEGAA